MTTPMTTESPPPKCAFCDANRQMFLVSEGRMGPCPACGDPDSPPARAALLPAVREPGFYHVRVCGDDAWTVALWEGKWWRFVGIPSCDDSEFAEIDERRITRTPRTPADDGLVGRLDRSIAWARREIAEHRRTAERHDAECLSESASLHNNDADHLNTLVNAALRTGNLVPALATGDAGWNAGVEAAAKVIEERQSPFSYDELATFIRSLAKPTPPDAGGA